MILLSAHSLTYTYPSRHQPTLTNYSGTIAKGRVYRIVGRNGSGKSTLLKVLAGLLTPEQGTTNRYGNAIYLNQDANAFTAEHLTVREQLLVGGRDSAAAITQRIGSYGVGLEDQLDDFVLELSGGQRQIVALLTVLLSNVDIVCLDEFMSAMDPVSIKNTQRILQDEVAKRSLSIVYISHLGGLFPQEETIEL